MRMPIAHCLAWPERIEGPADRLDLAAIGQLTFEAPDPDRFPALALARQALAAGGGGSRRCSTPPTRSRWRHSWIGRTSASRGIARLVEATMNDAGARPTARASSISTMHFPLTILRDADA